MRTRTKQFGHYFLVECTAVAKTAGDTKPQGSILLFSLEGDGSAIMDSAMVVFGAEFDDIRTGEDIQELLENSPYASQFTADLETVRIGGKRIWDFCFNGDSIVPKKEWTREEICAFYNDPSKEFHCWECPHAHDGMDRNRGDFVVGPCGQQTCWVACHTREVRM